MPGPQAYAYLEFFGTNGAYYRKDLLGGEDIRNYNKESPATAAWTQTINGTTTTEVLSYDTFGSGQRVDMQRIDLSSAFQGADLLDVRLTDLGTDITQAAYDAGDRNFQRVFLAGLTVASLPQTSVPEPGSWALWVGAGVVALSGRRRKKWEG